MLVASLLLGSNSKAIKDKLSISAIPGKPPLGPIQLLDLCHFLSIKSFYPLMRCSSAKTPGQVAQRIVPGLYSG